jgi:hypothetical protein
MGSHTESVAERPVELPPVKESVSWASHYFLLAQIHGGERPPASGPTCRPSAHCGPRGSTSTALFVARCTKISIREEYRGVLDDTNVWFPGLGRAFSDDARPWARPRVDFRFAVETASTQQASVYPIPKERKPLWITYGIGRPSRSPL